MSIRRWCFRSMCVLVVVGSSAGQVPAIQPTARTMRLRALIEASPKLPLQALDLPIKLPPGQELGKVSWIARDPRSGGTWLIQRGDKAAPVMEIDRNGEILHAFGKGLYAIPHAIRLDPEGNVWTVDAGSSMVIKYSPEGKKLLTIDVGGQPESAKSPFRGTTDVAFGPGGRVFVSDGYANARILEYSADGVKIREWGMHGTAAGEFHLPHSIVIDEQGVMYVADRENGRIERFNLEGKYLGEIANLGRTYSLQPGPHGTLWAGTAPMDEPTGAPGWIVQLDRTSGKILGYVPVTESGGLHSVADDGAGDPMTPIGNRIVVFVPMAR